MFRYLPFALRYLIWRLSHLYRRLRKPPDYVVFILEDAYPELRPPRDHVWERWFFPPPTSLQDLAEQFRTIAGDPRVRGVLLHLRSLYMPFAHLQTLRDLIKGLRAAGKHVAAWACSYDNASYYVACAANEILLQPGGSISPLGLRRSFFFLADALNHVGVKADIVQISPYKSAADLFTRSQMSQEVRQMVNWLIDDHYAEFIRGVGEGRRLDEGRAKALVDNAPYTDLKALEAGVVDKQIGEEDLPAYLGEDGKPARLAFWETAHQRLLRRPLPRPGRYVALLRIEGDIVNGRSQRPPFKPPVPLPFLFNERAGDLTVVQKARRALADKRAAAVVVYVDSGGGSATASEAMAAALEKVSATKPLIVAMGSVAASGGYYVATPARWIVAQPGTITGSIGVLAGKIVSVGLLDKLLIHRETVSRGQHAGFYDIGRPFNEEERRRVWEDIHRIYDVFLDRVAASRKMAREAVDAVGGGRVWTGRQAFERGLVDELGGLDKALAKARQLAGLDDRAPVREIKVGKRPLAPRAEPNLVHYPLEGLRLFHQAGTLCLCPLIWEEVSKGI